MRKVGRGSGVGRAGAKKKGGEERGGREEENEKLNDDTDRIGISVYLSFSLSLSLSLICFLMPKLFPLAGIFIDSDRHLRNKRSRLGKKTLQILDDLR